MEAIVPIFIVITVVVSWLVNLGKQNEQKQRREERLRQRRERAGAGGRARANDFMNEGDRRQQAMQRGNSIDEDVEVEIVQPAKSRRPPRQPRSRDDVWREQTGRGRQRAQPQPQQQPKSARQPAPQRPAQPAPKPAPVNPQPSNLSSRHVQPTVGKTQLSNLNEQHLAETVAQQVSRDLGVFGAVEANATGPKAQSETTRRRPSPSSALRGLLRNPQSVRQAIIISEVLSPPKSLRNS